MAHLDATSDALLVRVRKIAGQVNAVEKAISTGMSCTSTLHRVAAVRGAVNGLLDEIIATQLEKHVASPGLDDLQRAQGADELQTVIRRYLKKIVGDARDPLSTGCAEHKAASDLIASDKSL